MTGTDLIKMGFPKGPVVGVALRLIPHAAKSLDDASIGRELRAVLADPIANAAHAQFAELARALRAAAERPVYAERPEPAPYKIWGEGLEEGSLEQMRQAARLPVAVAGALMPDAHLGYGLPIGGVHPTENPVIPHSVGVYLPARSEVS